MAEIVGGFLLPHDPLIFQASDAAPAAQRDRVFGAYAHIRDRIAALGADTAIVVGADHYILFGPQCLPSFLIAIGDLDGPVERLPGFDRGPVAAHPILARHLFDSGRAQGFDWACAKTMTLDHSIMIPHKLCIGPHAGMRTIPVYLASGVAPMVAKRRALSLGEMIGQAVRAFPGDERVVVIGSGGISHWVGMAEMGRVGEAFDRRLLDLVVAGDCDAIADMDDDAIVAEGGNGALEVRNFLCAMGAMGPGLRGEVIAYEAVPEWITGLGFVELMEAA
jgi:protocatechuate 4,5-dioxygenase beta chain